MLNGRLPSSELAEIYDPSMKLFLAKDSGSVAGWNTMNLDLHTRTGKILLCEGPNGAYRTYTEQVILKRLEGSNAATPGTSNHGLGKAVDMKEKWMAGYVIQHGEPFGWGKNDAMWEWWHVNFVGSFHRPDPGTSWRFPILTFGSGGPGQRPHVEELQHLIHIHLGDWAKTPDSEYGTFTKRTFKNLAYFQKASHLKVDGVAGMLTWQHLRAPVPKKPKKKGKK